MLTLNQIKDFVTGAVRTWEEDGYLYFSRFTEKQRDVIVEREFLNREKATSGMRLEFTTKGGMLSFAYKAFSGCGLDNRFGVEIAYNGLPDYHLFRTDIPAIGEVFYEVPHGTQAVRVTVYFPNLTGFALKQVCLPEDAAPVCRPLKLLAYGDSITQGCYATHVNQTYINILADNLDAELLNQGVSGDQFFAGNLDQGLSFKPDLITVAYGVNDWANCTLCSDSPKLFLEKLTSLYSDCPVFVLLPIWFPAGKERYDGHTLQEGREFLTRVAKTFPLVTVIDCSSFVPHLQDYYGDCDLLHPSDMGFLYYGQALTRALKESELYNEIEKNRRNSYELSISK